MEPLDTAKKIAEQVEINETKREIIATVPRSFLYWWLLVLSLGGITVAFLGGWQVDRITQVLISIESKLTPLVDWQRAADTTIRYNTNRMNTIDEEHKASVDGEAHGHEHFVVPPKSCDHAKPGEPCLLD